MSVFVKAGEKEINCSTVYKPLSRYSDESECVWCECRECLEGQKWLMLSAKINIGVKSALLFRAKFIQRTFLLKRLPVLQILYCCHSYVMQVDDRTMKCHLANEFAW